MFTYMLIIRIQFQTQIGAVTIIPYSLSIWNIFDVIPNGYMPYSGSEAHEYERVRRKLFEHA
jgi:hypothetical protein